MKRNRIWVVVADGARARILVHEGPGTGLMPVEEMDSPTAHKPSRELTSDKPGRGHESATPTRHTVEPRVDWHIFEKERFAHDVAAMIEAAAAAGSFDQVVLAAPPKVLGTLRVSLGAATRGRLKGEVGKDLTKTPLAELGVHLLDALRP